MDLVVSNPDTPEVEYQPHSVSDPEVWGLRDVARGRTCTSPTTVYIVAGDNASGVAGMIFPDGRFLPKHSTRVGRPFHAGVLHDVKPAAGERTVAYATAWDGAKPEPMFIDEEGIKRYGRSKGILLGDYAIRGESTAPGRTRKALSGYIAPRSKTNLLIEKLDYERAA